MNALRDPTKKPSINSLLNPQESSGHPVGTNHDQNQSTQSSSMFQYGSVSSFNLRAASWDPDDDPHKRRPIDEVHDVHRQYQQHPTLPIASPHNFPDVHASRPRIDESSMYTSEGQVWQLKHSQQQQHQHERTISSMPYPSVMYSDERIALSGDYQPQSNYTSTYGDQSTSPSGSVWQPSERVSVRLAARGTISETQQLQTPQDARFSVPSYYTPPNVYSPAYSSQQLQPLQVPQQLMIPEMTQTLSEPSRLSSSSTSSSKRQLQEDESTVAPKAKRAKSKTTSATPGSTPAPGLSKRGYSAKKRSEAALITAQNADAFQRATASNESYQNGDLSSATNLPANNVPTHIKSIALVPELQYARCMSNRYRGEVFSRCVSCTRRWAGDTCRFQGIRYLLRGPDKKVSMVSFRENHRTVEPPAMQFPTVWNRKFKREHVARTKLSIAKALLPILKLEREHMKADELVRRARESEVRATCDTCMTSLFSASWMCRICGREVCHECFLQVQELTSEPSSASQAELAALQGKREKHAHSNPFFLSCNKRAEHGVRDFTPVTRFWNHELEGAIEEMEDILKRAEGGGDMDDVQRNGGYCYDPDSSPLSSPPPSDPAVVYDSYLPSNLSSQVRSIPVYRLQQIPASLYDPVSSPPSSPSYTSSASSSFTCLWTLGVPILVKDVLPRFKLTWTPEYFMQQYGEQGCLVIECQTDLNKRISVREFFAQFGKYEGRTECWKLKDWPPSTDFKSAFPGLFEDFSQAVPVPDYVRRDGVFNLGSHFPSNTVAPDLGPKMYNSMASSQEAGSKGSTRLHMDMADALNVMLYASKCKDGTEGYAVWDLFRAEDSERLREFLRRKFGQPQSGGGGQGLTAIGGGGGGGGASGVTHDPIHGQQFYLDVELRQALFDECGVKSYRVYQRPGDGVFIPAGCAHQVANMSDCMKVAIDFVSPENIDRCEKLTKEFREQNQSKVWKEDVLQLRTMMWIKPMTKPTLMQSLLNQPSQSYSIDIPRTQHQRSMSPASPPQQLKPPPTAYRHRLSYNEFEDLDPSEDSDREDLFFTPNTSPRTSMASSLLMFPTGRKPSRRSLRLSDSSDTVILASATPPASPTTKGMPPAPAVLSTRITAAPKRQYPTQNQRNIHDAISTTSSLSTTSLEPHSLLSDYIGSVDVTTTTADLDDKKMGRGITKRTRHGLVTIPSAIEATKSSPTSKQKNSSLADGDVKRPVPTPSSSPLPISATNGSAVSKRRSNQQGLVDGDLTKDVKRPVPTSSSSPPTVAATNGSAVTAASKRRAMHQGLPDGDLTRDVERPVPTSITHPPATASSTPNGSAAPVKSTTTGGHVLVSRRSSKSQAPTVPGPAARSKENMKSDVVVKTEPKMKEKEKEVDALTVSSSKLRKERPNTTPAPTPTPHTFSAFAPLPTPSSSALPANENANSSNSTPSLPPAGFSFPPPPSHSPQLPPHQPPQQRNSFNGSAAAYTYALRHKGNSSPKPGGASGSGMMNMAALLEEDEVDEGGDGSSPSRRLRRVPNGNGKGKGKEKRISDSTDSSHRSYSASHSQLNSNSPPPTNSHSESSTIRRPPKTMTSEVNAMSLSTPGELPSIGTQGFTSLVLPRAPLPLGSHSISIRSASTSGSGSRNWFGSVGKEGKIDLTRSGLAQTTMASVEVVRGLGSQNGLRGKLIGILRKRTVSSGTTRPRPIEGLSRPKDLSIKKAPTAAGVEGTILGFTSYRKPPGYIPSNSVLVQVWAVGVDGVDGRLVGVNFGDHVWRVGDYEDEEGGVESEWEREAQKAEESEDNSKSTPQQAISGLGRSFSLKRKPRGSVGSGPSRTFSLRRNNTPQSQPHHILTKSSSQKHTQRRKIVQKTTHKAEVGYIPGRSFVGRVLECGWDVRDETVKKGDWVVGLLDIKKCGALTEFIVVDRHRIHRVPHPRKSPEQQGYDLSNMAAEQNQNDDGLTLEELALLPLCGIPAYRAVRTFIYAFSSLGEGTSAAHDRRGVESGRMITTTEHPQDGRRRVLVLRGHDGAGAMAVQLLAKRGWKVSVHVPFSASSTTGDPTTTEVDDVDPLPINIQERARDWGADEIIFDEEVGDGIDDGRIAAIRVMESLREDGDMFDAILDTVGGKEVREAGERLLKSAGGVATPSGFEPPISPRARDKGIGVGQFTTLVGDVPERPIPTTADHLKAGFRSFGAESARNVDEGTDMKGSKVGYAWVGVALDVDWDGEDISETLGSVLQLALEERVRPVIGAHYRVVPFEQAPYVFVDKGPLGHGCNVVVKVAG